MNANGVERPPLANAKRPLKSSWGTCLSSDSARRTPDIPLKCATPTSYHYHCPFIRMFNARACMHTLLALQYCQLILRREFFHSNILRLIPWFPRVIPQTRWYLYNARRTPRNARECPTRHVKKTEDKEWSKARSSEHETNRSS